MKNLKINPYLGCRNNCSWIPSLCRPNYYLKCWSNQFECNYFAAFWLSIELFSFCFVFGSFREIEIEGVNLGSYWFLASLSDKVTKTSSNTSLNCCVSKRSWSIENRVFHVIDASDIELRSAEIARKLYAPKKPTRGQYTTVRVCIRKLLDKGPNSATTHWSILQQNHLRSGFVPLCVHNISLRSFVCQDVTSWEKDESIGGVKIHVCFGSERRKISGYIACDVGGMSHNACLLALNRWFDIVQDHLGWQLNDLQILTFDCNKDYHGVRIDGVVCVTKTDLFGMIERVYQKEENLVCKEQKTVVPMSVNKFEEAISNGFNDSANSQANFEIKGEVKGNSDAL